MQSVCHIGPVTHGLFITSFTIIHSLAVTAISDQQGKRWEYLSNSAGIGTDIKRMNLDTDAKV